ncbi:Type II traffic warden ATPase [Variovorax sp. PBL-E5]|nr:Type II traffic warden ATPase [Variovorax sp. PBL-E5]
MTPIQPSSAETPKATAASAGGRGAEFAWPNPPYAKEVAAATPLEPQPCEVVGLNAKRVTGRMTHFSAVNEVVHVQLPQARTRVTVRFDQFRTLTLIAPLAPFAVSGPRKVSGYRVLLNDGDELTGETLGHVETGFGLFLFPPAGDDGSVWRLFVPRASLQRFEVGKGAAAPKAAEGPGEAEAHNIGELLSSTQVSSREQLLEAIERQARMPIVRIGEALTSLGMITERELGDALAQQQLDRSVPLGEVLVRMGIVTRPDLQTALARKMGYPLVNLDAFPTEADALRKIGHAVAERLQVMPLLIHDGRLILAMDDPINRHAAIDEAEFSAQMKVVAVLGQTADLDGVQRAAYEKIGSVEGRSRSLETQGSIDFQLTDTSELIETLEKEGQNPSDDDAPIEQSDNSLVRLINRMILEAHREGVSDIHIESYPGREKIRIRFRKDGRLRTYLELPPNYRNAMIARVKIMCDLDISEKRKPQDGKINFAKFSPQHRIELRVATIPTNNGLEDVVMRILASAKPIALDRLGLSPYNLEHLKRAINRPYGMVLCVGPTGSGKTTTLHSALMQINVPERKIWTAEDPVEITQAGLRQVQVNPRIEWTFAKALRAFLRADPDVIMVGEIRDEETAKTAIEASLTGHLVLSTLHTNSAPETVTRLLDMGMDPFNFADSLLGVLAQRLVRRLCSQCIESRPATPEEVEELMSDYMHVFGAGDTPAAREALHAEWVERHGREGRLQRYTSVGCPACDKTGYKGRVGVHELMVMTRELRHLVQTGSRAELLQETALREGMRTLRQDGIEKVLAGQTSIDEVRATSNV